MKIIIKSLIFLFFIIFIIIRFTFYKYIDHFIIIPNTKPITTLNNIPILSNYFNNDYKFFSTYFLSNRNRISLYNYDYSPLKINFPSLHSNKLILFVHNFVTKKNFFNSFLKKLLLKFNNINKFKLFNNILPKNYTSISYTLRRLNNNEIKEYSYNNDINTTPYVIKYATKEDSDNIIESILTNGINFDIKSNYKESIDPLNYSIELPIPNSNTDSNTDENSDEFLTELKKYNIKLPLTVKDYNLLYNKFNILPSTIIKKLIKYVIKLNIKDNIKIFNNFNIKYILKQSLISDDYIKNGKARSILEGVPVSFKDMVNIKHFIKIHGLNPEDPYIKYVKSINEKDRSDFLNEFNDDYGEDYTEYYNEENKVINDTNKLIYNEMKNIIKDFNEQELKLFNKNNYYAKNNIDDYIVERFRNLGAIVLGHTIMVEAGATPLGFNTFDQSPSNVYSDKFYSGGSSSGCGVAVAYGISPICVGFDGGGSIRSPSSMSGIVGLATTYGRIPYDSSVDTSLVKAGPMTSNVADAIIGYAALAPNHPDLDYFTNKHYGGEGPPHPYVDINLINKSFNDFIQLDDKNILKTCENNDEKQNNGEKLLKNKKFGYFPAWFNDSDVEIRVRTHEVLNFLKEQGGEIVEIALPHSDLISLCQSLLISTEFAAIWDQVYTESPYSLEPNSQLLMGLGNTVSGLDIYYMGRFRSFIFEYVNNLFKDLQLSAIVAPTIGILPPVLTPEARIAGEINLGVTVSVMKHLVLANLLGLPAITVPVGFLEDKDTQIELPVGFQFIGDHWTDHELLKLAAIVENGFSKHKKVPLSRYLFNPFEKESN